MKKIFLIISIISVLFLAGCNKNVVENENNQLQEEQANNPNINDDVNNGVLENNENQIQDVDGNPTDNIIVKTDEEKYKLSDTYYISGETLEMDNCLINLFAREQKFEEHYKIESDGVSFNITCNLIESKNETQEFDVKVNGKIIEFQDEYIGDIAPFGEIGDYMWIIDLDENDNYKEMVIKRVWGIDEYAFEIYRFTRNGLEILFDNGTLEDELIKVNGKWIYTNYLEGTGTNLDITKGYYVYENGKFEFVERFATGENIFDENGEFPKKLQELEIVPMSMSTSKGIVKGKFNFISCKNEYPNSMSYTIRLTEDCECNGEEMLPAGTILEDVTFLFN